MFCFGLDCRRPSIKGPASIDWPKRRWIRGANCQRSPPRRIVKRRPGHAIRPARWVQTNNVAVRDSVRPSAERTLAQEFYTSSTIFFFFTFNCLRSV